MCPSGATCLSVDCCLSELALNKFTKKNSTKCVCIVQANIIMSLKYNLLSPWYNRYIAEFVLSNNDPLILLRSCRGHDHMVAGFTITYAMSGYHHKSCEFETCWWWGVLDTTLCDEVCQVGGFLRILRFPPSIQLTATIKKMKCHWKGIKHRTS